MNVKSVVENKEKFEVELTIEVGQEEFEAGLGQSLSQEPRQHLGPRVPEGQGPP